MVRLPFARLKRKVMKWPALLVCAAIIFSGSRPLFAQKSQMKSPKTPVIAFFDDLYQIYESMNSVLTFRTTLTRNRVESVAFDRLWGNLNIDPSGLFYSYNPFLLTRQFALLSTDFRFKPIKPMDVRLILTYLPMTAEDLVGGANDPYSYRKIQIGTTVNIADALQITGDFSAADYYHFNKLSNIQGFAIDQENVAANNQTAINGTYNHRIHILSLELRQLKNLFFEPRFRIDWVNDQIAYFRTAKTRLDPWVKMGNTSEYSDGLNGENEKNFLTFSAGFTLRPFNNLVLTGKYSLTPSLLESTPFPQGFNIHAWSLSFDMRLDKHFRFISSFSITRTEYRQESPYQSFFYDYTFDPGDPAVNTAVNTANRALNFNYNQRNVSIDQVTVAVEYR